jgi:hypothetical protein
MACSGSNARHAPTPSAMPERLARRPSKKPSAPSPTEETTPGR